MRPVRLAALKKFPRCPDLGIGVTAGRERFPRSRTTLREFEQIGCRLLEEKNAMAEKGATPARDTVVALGTTFVRVGGVVEATPTRPSSSSVSAVVSATPTGGAIVVDAPTGRSSIADSAVSAVREEVPTGGGRVPDRGGQTGGGNGRGADPGGARRAHGAWPSILG